MIAAQIRPLSLLLPQRPLLSNQIKRKTITMSSSAGTAHAFATATATATAEDSSALESMDPGCAFKLLLSCPSGLPRSRVFVDFSPRYDRTPHPDRSLEDSINQIWNQRLQEKSSLYNGLKFRYAGDSLHNLDDTEQDSSVFLHLGLTDYRTFVGTNLSHLWEKFLVPTEDDYERCQHTSSPLGNGAVVETTDNKILVLQRSHNVGEFPGYFVFPGGHSEPHEIGISSHQLNSSPTEAALLNQKVSQEMFEGIIREVVEEIGVPAESLCDPLFIGISRRDMNVRPTAFFFVRCKLGSEEVHQMYSRAEDGYESTHLYKVSKDELDKMALRMPGCHRGGYALYLMMVEATHAGSFSTVV